MTYPEPAPVLEGKDAEDLLRRLDMVRMTDRQKRLYRGAIRYYEEHRPGSFLKKWS